MFTGLIDIILNILSTVVQLVVLPINLLIVNTLPVLTIKINEVITALNSVFDSITWAIGVVPAPIIVTLLFILSVEIAKYTIYISTHALVKLWLIIQKVKFW